MELTIRALQTQHVGIFAWSHNPLRTGSIYALPGDRPPSLLPSAQHACCTHIYLHLVVQTTSGVLLLTLRPSLCPPSGSAANGNMTRG
jgi:hypothetical protein